MNEYAWPRIEPSLDTALRKSFTTKALLKEFESLAKWKNNIIFSIILLIISIL